MTHLAGPEAAGIYTAGRWLALPLLLAGGAVGTVLLPRFSRLAASGQIDSQVRRIALAVAAGAGLLAVGGVALAPSLVPLVYGVASLEAIVVFQLLVLAYGVQLATWPALTVLMVLDRPDLNRQTELRRSVRNRSGLCPGGAILWCGGCRVGRARDASAHGGTVGVPRVVEPPQRAASRGRGAATSGTRASGMRPREGASPDAR